MAEARRIQTKLRPPRVAGPVIKRPRLSRRLSEHAGRVVLISAPAGFGKTVLAVDWLSSRTGPAAWLSLDPLDDDFSRFTLHLAAAVESLGLPGASEAAGRIEALSSQEPGLPPGLLDCLVTIGPDAVLVLEDLHEIGAPEVIRVVEWLVQASGAGPRLVLLTREDPPIATGRLRVRGELLELRANDLRFTESEAAELFDRLLPGLLEPGLIHQLEARTEGWPAGLRLAAIALHDADDPAAMVTSFAGTHRFVMDYLLEEALGRQTPAVHRFLMETSILGRFSRESCIFVTGDPEAGARLAEVEQAGLFLVPLGGDGEWFRYHHLFAELLRYRLAAQPPDRLEALHARASAWFEADGDLPAALEQAARMRGQTRLLELLDARVLDMLGRGEMAALRHWTGQVRHPLPGPYPMVLCSIGWLQVVTDRAPDLEGIVGSIRSALDRAGDGYDPRRRRRAETHIDVLSAYAARYEGRYEDALRIHAGVESRLSSDDPLTRGLLTYNTARARMALADMRGAEAMLEQAFGDHLRSGNLYLTLASLGRTAGVLAQTRGIPAALESLAAAVAFAEERGLESHPAFSIVLYHRGLVHYLADQLDRAEESFRRAVELTSAEDFPEERVNGLVGLVRVALARGHFEDAEARLVEAATLAQDSNTDLVDSTLELERVRLAIRREAAGGPPAPPMSPPVESAGEPGPWTTIRETEAVLRIGQALRAERFDEAAPLIEELERESEQRDRGPALCAALLARARLPECEGRWEILDRALGLGVARGYVRPFLDGGPPLRELLRGALLRSPSLAAREHAADLLRRLDDDATQTPALATPAAEQLLDPLTEREEEVLLQLFHGLSNKAIARSMFVSVDTVKTHLKRVYAKLGVADRGAAVARARELGITPMEG